LANDNAFGAGNKFITPMIANGRVYVGTPTGVAVFGGACTGGADERPGCGTRLGMSGFPLAAVTVLRPV
jgi:hypothetical protein